MSVNNKEAVKNLEIMLDSLERRVARNILIPDAIQAVKMGIEAIEFCERRSIGLSGNIGERKCLGLGVNDNESKE